MDKLDRDWLTRHPLPVISEGGDKNARGLVFVIGGAAFVPGALRLTGEAALRAGAGKLRMATVEQAALPLGVLIPEASMIALPADGKGEIAAEAVEAIAARIAHCDAVVLGPGMSASDGTQALVAGVLRQAPAEAVIVLDAGALAVAGDLREAIAARGGRTIMTPHHGEMAHLSGLSREQVKAEPRSVAERTAREFGAVIALKGEKTIVMAPDGASARFEGGNNGLATSGSGDVLAGLVGGFAARGADPITAAAWGVFVHGTAGERAAEAVADIGYLARELLAHVPRLVQEHGTA
jgi:ADP-dependent NAD(P)H-hydrate dehydratase